MRDKYLLTEGHLLGFFMGTFLTRQEWYGIATLWVGILMVLYVYRFWKMGKTHDRDFQEDKTETLRYTMTYRDRAELSVTPIDVLVDAGFDTSREIVWRDDPVRGVRIFTQEKPNGDSKDSS